MPNEESRSLDLAVGVDVGGTKLAAALVDRSGTVLDRRRVATPADDPDAIMTQVADLARDLLDHARHDGAIDPRLVPVGVATPGAVNDEGVLRYGGPNLSVDDYPLAARLRERLANPLAIDNDSRAAAWAEYILGAGRGAASMLAFTVGTGVGGSFIVNGAPWRGHGGWAGEFGHLVVQEGNPNASAGISGALEALANGPAIARYAKEIVEAGERPESALHQLPLITGKAVTQAAHAGDEAAIAVLAQAGTWLGVGIASLVNALDPQIVVVGGGGAVGAGDLLLDPARQTMATRLYGGPRRAPEIVLAQLGDDAGVIGAALLAMVRAHTDVAS